MYFMHCSQSAFCDMTTIYESALDIKWLENCSK
jgi:hypothetical protein